MTKVACIGAGSFGTTVAGLAALNGHDVCLWCRRPELAAAINADGINASYLPGIRLPEGLRAVGDIQGAVAGGGVRWVRVPHPGGGAGPRINHTRRDRVGALDRPRQG